MVLNFFPATSHARDYGQWEKTDPTILNWYKNLKQPDNPSVSCCGEADAYWCDVVYVRDKKTYCRITDDRDNEPLKRIPVPMDTEIQIPDHKLTYKDGNPTGHVIVFLSIINVPGKDTEYNVYCFVQNGGT